LREREREREMAKEIEIERQRERESERERERGVEVVRDKKRRESVCVWERERQGEETTGRW